MPEGSRATIVHEYRSPSNPDPGRPPGGVTPRSSAPCGRAPARRASPESPMIDTAAITKAVQAEIERQQSSVNYDDLSVEELEAVIEALLEPTKQGVQFVLEDIDRDKDEHVNKGEVQAWWAKNCSPDLRAFERAWLEADENCDDELSAEELKIFLGFGSDDSSEKPNASAAGAAGAAGVGDVTNSCPVAPIKKSPSCSLVTPLAEHFPFRGCVKESTHPPHFDTSTLEGYFMAS